MRKYLQSYTLSLLAFLSFLLQGCGGGQNNKKTSKKYPTAIGEGVSLINNDSNTFNNDTQKLQISKLIGKVVQTQIDEINQQEATLLTQALHYCEVSGQKELKNTKSLETITISSNYESCENDNNRQHGNTITSYEQTNEDGKFPKILSLTAQNNYNFNNLTLQEETSVLSSDIIYNNDHSINSMNLIISGVVELDSKIYHLNKHQEVIKF